MEVTFHVTTSFGMTHVILKTITRTRTLKGGGFGLTASLKPHRWDVGEIQGCIHQCMPKKVTAKE